MNTFRYKLDFYYQLLIIYLITLILYVVIRGTFIDERFEVVYRDPIVYIMLFFVLFSAVILLINWVRQRRIVIEENAIKFINRFKEWVLPLYNIEWMYITREEKVKTSGRMQVIVIKRKNKKRLVRIRVGRYEHPHEFLKAMKEIAERVPKGAAKKKIIRRRRKKI